MFKSALHQLRSHPVIALVSIGGTALCLLLVSMVTIVAGVGTEPVAPESNRPRLLYDNYMMVYNGMSSSSSGLSRHTIDRLYSNLNSAELVSVCENRFNRRDIEADGAEMVMADIRGTDGNYWRVYDHRFLAGRPFTADDMGRDRVILTRSVAGKLFGSQDPIGKTVRIRMRDYEVTGVVEDVPAVMGFSYAQAWTPISNSASEEAPKDKSDFYGPYAAVILAREGVSPDEVYREAQSRVPALQEEIKMFDDFTRKDADRYPFANYQLQRRELSGAEGDADEDIRMNWILIGIFLIIPAINLSGMTRFRLRSRRHEIGVRRAFGATRTEIFSGILGENLIITLCGGVAGLALSFVFVWLAAPLLVMTENWNHPGIPLEIPMSMLFSWRVFGTAFLFCFILNLLSSGVPAWRAARENPAEAINSKD